MECPITLSNNQLDDFNRLAQTAFGDTAALRIGILKLQVHFLRFDRLEPGFRVAEHVHPNYEVALVRRGGMTTRFDNLRVENSPHSGKFLLIPPSVPHSREFISSESTVNQSLAFTLTVDSLCGEAAVQQFDEVVRRNHYLFDLTPEMGSFLRLLDRQPLRRHATAAPMMVALTNGLLLSIFEAYFPSFPDMDELGPEKFRREFGSDRVSMIKAFVEYSINSNCPLPECARLSGLGMRHLSRIFEAETGSSIYSYYTRRRVEIASRELIFSDRSIAEIANSMHFRTPGTFSRFFRSHTGMSPGEFRRNRSQACL